MRKHRLGPALAAVLLMMTLLAGCGGAPSSGQSSGAGQQAAGQQPDSQGTQQPATQQGAGQQSDSTAGQQPAGQQTTDQPAAGQGNADQPAASAGGQTVYPITLIDGDGREITIESEPQRILSLGPSITELLFALGRGDRLVGRTDWCNFPEAALEVPSVGSLFPPDYERILATEPDLVLMLGGSLDVRERMEQEYGLTTFVVEPSTFAELYDEVLALGQVVNASAAAEALVAEIRAEVEAIEAKTAALTERPDVFYVVWMDPLMSAGPGSFIHDMIQIAGGVNVAGHEASAYPTVSMEQVLAADPDVIVASQAVMLEEILGGPGWESVKAVREGRVIGVPNEDIMARPGPRLIEGLRWFAGTLHPDLFGQ